MTKSKFVIEKIAKLLEQGLISYKDLSSEILNIIKSKKDEFIFKLDLSTKEELEILKKRLEIVERKLERKNKSKKTKKVKKSYPLNLSLVNFLILYYHHATGRYLMQ